MLVLSRKESQTIVIDGPCVVRVHEIRKGQVRLAIEAPAAVRVRRGELVQRGGGELPGAIPAGELRPREE
jgi:carbon storage regulator CsrA